MDNSSPDRVAPPLGAWRGELAVAWRALSAWRRRGLLALAAAALLAWGSQLVEMPWRSALRGSDNSFYYFWLRSLMVDGDWSFRNDVQECNTLPEDFRTMILQLPPTEVGRFPNKYGIGWALLSTPFYLAADATVATGNALGVWSLKRDGFNPVYQIALHAGHFALALGALCLPWRCCGGRVRWFIIRR